MILPEPWPSVAVPIVVSPSRKVTVPVADEGETVAVKVTGSSRAAGLASAVRMVVLVAWLTVWVTVFEVEPASLLSPP